MLAEGSGYNMNVFADALKDSLDERGWSHGELARRIAPTSQQTVSRWIAGENLPQRNTVVLVADALGEDREKWRSIWSQSDTSEPPTHRPPRRDLEAEVAWVRSAVERILAHLGMPAEDTPTDEPAPRRRRRA